LDARAWPAYCRSTPPPERRGDAVEDFVLKTGVTNLPVDVLKSPSVPTSRTRVKRHRQDEQDLQDGSIPQKHSHPVHPAILSKTNFRHVTMAAVREDDFSGESATTTASG
jgi:hypothetical protein